MSTILLNGTPINVGGQFPRVADTAHSFMLVDTNLQDVALSKYWGQRKMIGVIPSIDAAIGLTIARKLEALAHDLDNTAVMTVSVDTPYALSRVQESEGFRKVHLFSTLRGRDFHKDYGVMITDVPLSGLMAAALIVLDTNDTVLYAELVPDLNSEPNYEEALKALFESEQIA